MFFLTYAGLNFSPSLFELGKIAIHNSVNDDNTLLYRHVLAKWAVLQRNQITHNSNINLWHALAESDRVEPAGLIIYNLNSLNNWNA